MVRTLFPSFPNDILTEQRRLVVSYTCYDVLDDNPSQNKDGLWSLVLEGDLQSFDWALAGDRWPMFLRIPLMPHLKRIGHRFSAVKSMSKVRCLRLPLTLIFLQFGRWCKADMGVVTVCLLCHDIFDMLSKLCNDK